MKYVIEHYHNSLTCLLSRERSRSDGEVISNGNNEEMDTSVGQSTISVTVTFIVNSFTCKEVSDL